jgi:hypothetical protein
MLSRVNDKRPAVSLETMRKAAKRDRASGKPDKKI